MKLSSRGQLLVAALLLLIAAASVQHFHGFVAIQRINDSLFKQGNFNRTKLDGNILILYWDSKRDGRDERLPEPFFENCVLTANKDLMREARAVVFDFQQLPTSGSLPRDWNIPYRNQNQVFVWRGGEAPGSILQQGFDLAAYPEHFFNWTLSVRRDSDVYQPYSTIDDVMEQVEVGEEAVDELIANKTDKLAIWIVSNCGYTYGARDRMAYSEQLLNAGLRLERFGACFPSSKRIAGDWTNSPALRREIQQYKFYLAFENALHCKDYFTEKFWRNALTNDAVPIVWGPNRADVEAVAPRGSFIHSDDFASPTELVAYIDYLDANVSAYREYFKWREVATKARKDPDDTRLDAMASLCKALKEGRPSKTIASVYDYFVASNPPECYRNSWFRNSRLPSVVTSLIGENSNFKLLEMLLRSRGLLS